MPLGMEALQERERLFHTEAEILGNQWAHFLIKALRKNFPTGKITIQASSYITDIEIDGRDVFICPSRGTYEVMNQEYHDPYLVRISQDLNYIAKILDCDLTYTHPQ